jgi:hypothetical protein
MGSALLTLIGTLAGAVVGGIGSYVTNSRTTARTLRVQTENTLSALDAEHGQRLQNLQAPAYEQAIAALNHRRDKREHDLSPVRWDERTETVVRSTLDDYQPPNWYESQSQLALYASQPVLDANEVANDAHEKILGLTRELADLREAAAAADLADHNARVDLGRQHKAIFEKIQSALKEAATADSNLIQLMRTSVHTRPSQYLPAGPGAGIDSR